MNVFIAVIGFFIVATMLVGFIMPSMLNAVIDSFKVTTALRIFGGVFRMIFGALLVYVAPETSFTLALQIIGGLIFVAGVIVLFVSNRLIQTVIDWVRSRPANLIRAFCFAAMAFGAFLAFAVLY